jgi:hypothetical protein
MLKKHSILVLSLAVLLLILSACRSQAEEAGTVTPLNPEAVYTAAAQTAEARMTEMAGITPTPTQALPTETQVAASDTPVSGTPTQTPPPSPVGGGIDMAAFIVDVTVPDGANYAPGDTFKKTWRLQNIGTMTWTIDYALVFVSGSQMGGAAAVPLVANTLAGNTVDLTVDLVAPAEPGTYTGYWMLRNAAGKNFGLGPNADGAFYVMINVIATATQSAATATPGTGTPAPTATAGEQSVVSNVTLSVDDDQVETPCPHTFNFSAKFTLSEAAAVTYRLNADTGFDITLPAATTIQLASGTHEVNYALEFTNDLTGWAQFLITAPEEKSSAQVNFELNCQ